MAFYKIGTVQYNWKIGQKKKLANYTISMNPLTFNSSNFMLTK